MKYQYLFTLLLCFIICKPLWAQNSSDSLNNSISIQYDHYYFDKQFDKSWNIASIEYKRLSGTASYIGRVQFADRLNKKGLQLEGETYVVFSKKVYSYFGLGFSPNVPVFPKWRTGASVYVSLPKGFEIEGGYRHLQFIKNIWIGTTGVSKYAGRWLLNLRSFKALNEAAKNQSYFFTSKYYMKNEKDFIWLQIGSGVSPDESRNVLINGNNNLSSKRITIGSRFSINKYVQASASFGWAKDEIKEATYGNQLFGSIGVSRRF